MKMLSWIHVYHVVIYYNIVCVINFLNGNKYTDILLYTNFWIEWFFEFQYNIIYVNIFTLAIFLYRLKKLLIMQIEVYVICLII